MMSGSCLLHCFIGLSLVCGGHLRTLISDAAQIPLQSQPVHSFERVDVFDNELKRGAFFYQIEHDRDPEMRYKVIREIGKGAYGKVYSGLQFRAGKYTKQLVAIKFFTFLQQSQVHSFLSEVEGERILRQNKARNYVQFIATSNVNKVAANEYRHGVIIMPFYGEGDLYGEISGLIQTKNERSDAEKEEKAFGIVSAMVELFHPLQTLWAADYVYYDYKFENTLVDKGHYFLTDYGLISNNPKILKRHGSLLTMSPRVAYGVATKTDNPMDYDGYSLMVSMIAAYKLLCAKTVVVDGKQMSNELCVRLKSGFPYDAREFSERSKVIVECAAYYSDGRNEQSTDIARRQLVEFFARGIASKRDDYFKSYQEAVECGHLLRTRG